MSGILRLVREFAYTFAVVSIAASLAALVVAAAVSAIRTALARRKMLGRVAEWRKELDEETRRRR